MKIKTKFLLSLAIITILTCVFFLLSGCEKDISTNKDVSTKASLKPTGVPGPTEIPINAEGTTIKDRFIPPEGYKRIDAPEGSFGAYLQNFQLKAMGEPAYFYNEDTGSYTDESDAAGAAIAVFNQEITRWQQCADSIMRLYAEYRYERGEYDKIVFNFTTGFLCDFKHYSEGYRVSFDKKWNASWVKKAEPNTDRATFDAYLDFVFQWANTESLQAQMKPVSVDDIQIGDSFVITSWQMDENLGHAVFVADMCVNEKGEKLYLIFEGTTPATQITLAKHNDTTYGYWIKLAEDGTLAITKTVFDDAIQEYKEKTWTCPGKYIRRFE